MKHNEKQWNNHGPWKKTCAPHPKNTVCAIPSKYRVRHTQKIPCAPLPKNIVCATPKKYRVRHSPKKTEDQSGGPRTNLEVFGDEVSFQYFQKTWKSISPMPCKTKSRQSSRESVCMVHAMPLDTPRPPKYHLKLSENGFCEKLDFSIFL